MERWFILMGIKYMPTLLDYLRVSRILNLSPSLQHSLLKKWKQLPFFHKVAKKGKSSIFGQERFPLCECFSDYKKFGIHVSDNSSWERLG